jgi:phosphatidylserine decarboxylase
MSDIQKVPATTLGIKWEWPSIHPEGRKFAVISGGICGFFALIGWAFVAWLMVGVTIWVAAFFRDPVRSVPQGDDLIISPADGMVCLIEAVTPPSEFLGDDKLGTEPLVRVSVFMSAFADRRDNPPNQLCSRQVRQRGFGQGKRRK